MQGDFSPETVPFLWVALNVGGVGTTPATPKTPGYYFVTYSFEFTNPLGASASYLRGVPMPLSAVEQKTPSTSAVVIASQRPRYPIGTVLKVENVGVTYSGSVLQDLSGIQVLPFYQGLDLDHVEQSERRQPALTLGQFKPLTVFDEAKLGEVGLMYHATTLGSTGTRSVLVPSGMPYVLQLYSSATRRGAQLLLATPNAEADGGIVQPLNLETALSGPA